MGFRITLGAFDFILGKAAGALDGNLLFLAGALSTLDMVGRAMNSTSVAGQSQPSLSRSQAHSTLVSPFSNRASTSRRSLALISPDTASANTPASWSRPAIS